MLLKDQLMQRLTSRIFLLPVAIVTGLFVMDVCALSLFGGSNLIATNPMLGYGPLFTIYLVCILEAFGFSVFAKFAISSFKKLLKSRVS